MSGMIPKITITKLPFIHLASLKRGFPDLTVVSFADECVGFKDFFLGGMAVVI